MDGFLNPGELPANSGGRWLLSCSLRWASSGWQLVQERIAGRIVVHALVGQKASLSRVAPRWRCRVTVDRGIHVIIRCLIVLLTIAVLPSERGAVADPPTTVSAGAPHSSDGTCLTSNGQWKLHSSDAFTPEDVSIAVSGDGRVVAVAGATHLECFDVQAGAKLQDISLRLPATSVALNANGGLVAVAFGDPLVDVFEIGNGERKSQLHRKDGPDFLRQDRQRHVTFLPSGELVVSTGSQSRVYVSDVASGGWQNIQFIKSNTYAPMASPLGEHVVLYGEANERELAGQLFMFRIRKGLQPLWTRWHSESGEVNGVAFSPDGKAVAGFDEKSVSLWDVESGDRRAGWELGRDGDLLGLAFAGQENLYALSSDRIEIRASDDGSVVEVIALSPFGPAVKFAADRDGTVLFTLHRGFRIRRWHLNATDFQGATTINPANDFQAENPTDELTETNP